MSQTFTPPPWNLTTIEEIRGIHADISGESGESGFCVGEYLLDIMLDHGWGPRELAERMRPGASSDDIAINELVIWMTLFIPRKDVILGESTAQGFATAFETSVELWLNLDKAWREKATPPTGDRP